MSCEKDFLRRWIADPAIIKMPNGESLVELQERAWNAIEDIITQIKTSPHTQMAVYKKSIDRVVGFLHLRKVLVLVNQDDFDKQSIINLLSKPSFIPESTPVHTQMLRFKSEKIRIGLVVDEYGDVQGLVTLDDLLQEIVGEFITDDAIARKQSDGSYLVDAGITVRELTRLMQWSLPTEGPKTLNGLIIEFMETIPEPGTGIKLPDDFTIFSIQSIHNSIIITDVDYIF
jgi:Mg2+/Co2+ transporter CorB